jgi:hypothetical protein
MYFHESRFRFVFYGLPFPKLFSVFNIPITNPIPVPVFDLHAENFEQPIEQLSSKGSMLRGGDGYDNVIE